MADSYANVLGRHLLLEVSEFALIFAVFNDLLEKECSGLLASPGIAELKQIIRPEDLDHDWYHCFDLGTYLREETDYAALQELVAHSIKRIKQVGWEHGVPTTFYAKFEGARFAPPFPDGTNWRAVAWPFVQLAMVPMLRHRLDSAGPLLKALGW